MKTWLGNDCAEGGECIDGGIGKRKCGIEGINGFAVAGISKSAQVHLGLKSSALSTAKDLMEYEIRSQCTLSSKENRPALHLPTRLQE